MKEEELEEQAEHQACAHIGISSYKRNPDAHSLFKTGFRVGAKCGMKHAIGWHKAEELPPMETKYYTINVLTDTQEIAYFDIQTNEWIRDSSSTIIDTPSHWCKIPKYKE